jgi:DNA-binding IclR family transcriptional regulator
VVAAISVSGPTARLTRARTTTIGRLLLAEARTLSSLLGHPGLGHPSEARRREGVA